MKNKSQHKQASWDLVVFSHLRWEFVTQRPQHLIGRMARKRKIIFVEEPIEYSDLNKNTLNIINPFPNITVIQPRIDPNDRESLSKLINDGMEKQSITNPILWFYTPMFVDMTNYIDHQAVIYDCMDELSAFKGAPQELVNKEKELFEKAGIIFTGGKSLYESKKKSHSNVFCFPSSVDIKHFETCLYKDTKIPDDVAELPKPVLGFYGVIDERIDLELLSKAAQIMPNVSFVMIGPIVKIAENDLPKEKNIYYLGGRSYEQLPLYLKSFDIAFMPFALNKHTEFISPTKTLEFMAGMKPIISTAIHDVVRDYSEIVKIVKTAEDIKQAVEYFTKETNEEKQKREANEKEILDNTSWDKTESEMDKIITNFIENEK